MQDGHLRAPRFYCLSYKFVFTCMFYALFLKLTQNLLLSDITSDQQKCYFT